MCMWCMEVKVEIVLWNVSVLQQMFLQSVAHGLGCTLYLCNEHNVCMGHSDLVENCRTYVVKRKPS